MSSRALGLVPAQSPETEWGTLAPLLSARGRMRVSRDGGRNYRARDERDTTADLPNQPAALLVYDRTGCAPTICLDLDASRGGREAVDRDLLHLTRLFIRLGVRWFSDTSPNGGRHIYLPLADPVPITDVKAFMSAIQARTPTLDALPMLNVLGGCIRPPGARHKSGGHQRLDQSISVAVDALRRPTARSVWSRLFESVGARNLAQPTDALATGDTPVQLDSLRGFASPDESFMRIARTGDFDTSKYRSPSEARQAVLWSAAAAGWAFVDVARRVTDGTWPGLASFYARYDNNNRHKALARDWHKAIAFEQGRRKAAAESSGSRSVRQSTTSPLKTQRGVGVNREVRVWLAAVDFVTRTFDPAIRAVLYALGEAAALRGDLVVEHGNRSLAIATGLDQATVGRVLKLLREAPRDRLLIDLVRPAEGVRASAYALVIPELLRPAAEAKPWRRGKIYAIRPAFRELGMVAAFVYGGLEQQKEAIGGRELAASVGFGHSSVYEALLVLSSWGLATRTIGGWVLGPARLQAIAEQLDVDVKVAAQVAKYRAERLLWWQYLGLVDTSPKPASVVDLAVRRAMNASVAANDPPENAALALLMSALGAAIVKRIPRG